MNPEVEQARREFLDECDFVAKVPFVYFFDGNPSSFNCSVFPISLYAYVGLKENPKSKENRFEIKEPDHKIHFGLDKLSASSMRIGSDSSWDFLFFENKIFSNKIQMGIIEKETLKHIELDTKVLKILQKCKIKIWTEANWSSLSIHPLNPDEIFSCAIGIILCCLKYRNVKLINEKLDAYRIEMVKNLDKANKFNLENMFSSKKLTESRTIFEEIFRYSFLIRCLRENGASFFCALFGNKPNEEEKATPLTINYEIPFFSIKDWELGSHAKDLTEIITMLKGDKSKIFSYLNYLDRIIKNYEITVSFLKNFNKGAELLFVYWEGTESELFGDILGPIFFDYYGKIQLEAKVKKNEPIRNLVYFFRSFRLFAPYDNLRHIIQKFKDSKKGWIQYCSAGYDGWRVEGARLLLPEEYKLPKPQKGKVITEEPAGEKAEYVVWESRKGERPASSTDAVALKKNKTITLLLDEASRIYSHGEDVSFFFRKKRVSYLLLKYLIEQGGHSDMESTFREWWKIKQKGKRVPMHKVVGLDDKENVKRAIRHLNDVLSELSVKGRIESHGDERFAFDPAARLCRISKKEEQGI